MKKVWKGAAAAIAAISLGVTGFVGASSAYAVTEGKASITITNFDSTHSYKIYQLMTGTVSTMDGQEVITQAQWGADANQTGAVPTTVLNTLSGLTSSDATKVAAVLAYVNTSKGNAFTNGMELNPGYYVLIDQTQTVTKPGSDSKALPIIALLQAGEEFKINEKHDTVTAIKKVKENVKDITAPTATTGVESKVDDKYNDAADYSIGDNVEYEFIASVPANIDQYDYYKYTFTDTLSTGLTFNNDVQVYLGESTTALDNTGNANYTVAETSTPRGFTVDFGTAALGLKAVPGVLDANGKRAVETIKIKFSATLNENAVVTTTAGNSGNLNTMHLSYSSNPQDKDEYNTTPDDSVIVFTYKLDFNKVDGTDAATKLEGAQFVIKNSDGKYAKADTNGKLSGWLNTKPNPVTPAEGAGEPGDEGDAAGLNAKPNPVTPAEGDTTDYRAQGIFISGDNGFFGIQGLDDGTYTLEEIKAPEGYSIGQNQTFVISGTLGTNGKGLQDWTGTTNALTAVKVNGTAWAPQNITNSKRSSLPETGGMGTTVLYVAGAAIVLIAGIGLAVALRRRQA